MAILIVWIIGGIVITAAVVGTLLFVGFATVVVLLMGLCWVLNTITDRSSRDG